MSFDVDATKLEALAKKSHNRCHGTGVAYYQPGGERAVICVCVWRKLSAQGINVNDPDAVKKAIGRDVIPTGPAEVRAENKEAEKDGALPDDGREAL